VYTTSKFKTVLCKLRYVCMRTVDDTSVTVLTPDVSSVTDPFGRVPAVPRTVAGSRRTPTVLNQFVGAVSCVQQYYTTSRLYSVCSHDQTR